MDKIIALADQVRADYLYNQTGEREYLPVRTSKLKEVVEARTGWRINERVVPGLSYLRGILIRKSDRQADVLIADSEVNNECWRRFTFIKEISHLFLEKDESKYVLDAYGLASSLVDLNPSDELYQRELIGVVAAVELLIPRGLNSDILARIANGDSNYQIAHIYKVPERYIEYRIRQMASNNVK